MKTSTIAKVRREVSRQFPEMKDVRPSVKQQGDDEFYLLIFKGKADLPGGRKISRVVRVVADERGRVVKMSTSK